MSSLFSLIRNVTGFGVVAALLLAFTPASATAQSVRGHATVNFFGRQTNDQISVNAWLDDQGVAQGMMVWTGDVPKGSRGGPTDPWFIAVTAILFDGNTAYVSGVVVHSVFPDEIGTIVFHAFTDNSAFEEPDEIDGIPLLAGNITVND